MNKRFRSLYAVLIGLIFLTDPVGYLPYLRPERAAESLKAEAAG
jgi:hypothetical protein